MRKFSVTLFLMAALSLGCLVISSTPATAESETGTNSVHYGEAANTYTTYVYPSQDGSFFFYPDSFVEFDVRNAKYFMISGPRYNQTPGLDKSPAKGLLGIFGGRIHTPDEYLNVTFFTPEGKQLASYREVRLNSVYSFPREGSDFEKVLVRIESLGADNIDVKFMIWDPVNPVVATPRNEMKKK